MKAGEGNRREKNQAKSIWAEAKESSKKQQKAARRERQKAEENSKKQKAGENHRTEGGMNGEGRACADMYEPEDLLPLAARLTKKYTGGESTSVTYETAQYLMEAVLYCINECGAERAVPMGTARPSAEQMYRQGSTILKEKVLRTHSVYMKCMETFCAYGNENYEATVTKAIPGFFAYYDPVLAPQETIITMDYPVLVPLHMFTGIDAIAPYVEYIAMEQRFLSQFPKKYVIDVLQNDRKGYERLFFNLGSVVAEDYFGEKMSDSKLVAMMEKSVSIFLV